MTKRLTAALIVPALLVRRVERGACRRNFEIYTMSAGGGGPTRLTTSAALDLAPNW